MRRNLTVGSILAGAAMLLLGACGSSDQSGTFETDEGTGSYKVAQDGDGAKVEVNGPNGETATVTSGANANAEFPAGFSLIAGGKVVSHAVMNQGAGSGVMILLQSAASPAEMTAFYRKQAEAAGISIENEIRNGEGEIISGRAADGSAFTFSANPGDDGTLGQLIYGSGGGG